MKVYIGMEQAVGPLIVSVDFYMKVWVVRRP
jgi:hypothetical protein